MLTTYASVETWEMAREGSLGGSSVGAVLGLSPWSSALEVWAEMRGLVTRPDPDEEDADRGRALEPVVLRAIGRRAGLDVEHTPLVIATRPDRPGEHYSPDGFGRDCHGGRWLLEAKATRRFSWADGDDVPLEVWAQVQHGMDLCELDQSIVGCDTPFGLVWQRIARDPAWERDYRPRIVEFLRCVRDGEPPAADGSKASARVLRAWPRDARAARWLPDDAAERVRRWKRAAARATRAERVADGHRQRLIQALGSYEVGLLSDGSALTLRRGVLRHAAKAPHGIEVSDRGTNG